MEENEKIGVPAAQPQSPDNFDALRSFASLDDEIYDTDDNADFRRGDAASARYEAPAAAARKPAPPAAPQPRQNNTAVPTAVSAIPPSRFTQLFGESKLLAVLTLIAGIGGIGWVLLYIGMLMERESLFTQTIQTMAVQGQYEYSVTFTSPLLGVLRGVLYLTPVFALVWALVVALCGKKNKFLGHKAVIITVLCVFALVGIVAVFDIAAAGLVFDIVKN